MVKISVGSSIMCSGICLTVTKILKNVFVVNISEETLKVTNASYWKKDTLINLEKSQEGHVNVNYNFLVKLYSELNADQKNKFNKSLQVSANNISKVG